MSNHSSIIIETCAKVGRIILDRPEALNALSIEMCESIAEALVGWANSPDIDRIVIQASPGKAFCAGGDVRMIASLVAENTVSADEFFRAEYGIHTMIARYNKPIIVIANGLTMGGGAGLLLNASHPVITTAMDFSMPETAIGLFPDVGASFFLRTAPDYVAAFLCMTGWRLGAGDMLHYNIAPYLIDSQSEAEIADAIIASADINAIESLLMGSVPAAHKTPIADAEQWIKSHFSKPNPVAIRQSLEGDNHPMAEKIRTVLDSRCPLSIFLAHRLFTDPDLIPADKAAAINQDFRLAIRMTGRPDFTEGVRAVLLDKDNAPQWQPDKFEKVTDAIILSITTPDNAPVL